METRIYRAPLGATSITVNGNTYEVDAAGNLTCNDDAAHADLLSHGYTYGAVPAAAADVVDHADFERALAAARGELTARADELAARAIELDARENALAHRSAELDELAATMAASRSELANKETELTMRDFAVTQREAALPPAPPATKAKA